MSRRIEDYALLADGRSAALLSRDGTIDWLCWPRFDSEPRFAALLGTPENGHWEVGPARPACSVSRCYETDTLVVRTDFECDGGHARLTDFMAVDAREPCIVRVVASFRQSVMRTRFGRKRRAAAGKSRMRQGIVLAQQGSNRLRRR